MKLFPQPITSPNRIEKYSPTLIRSIRSGNGRSKSRRRSSSSSRLSPMFSIRTTKRNNNGRNETTLEPSSPKVNCCGEIRVKRSSSNQTTTKKIVKTNHTHNWIQKILFCKCSSIVKTKKKSRPVLGKWLVCLQIGCLQKRVEEVVEDDNHNMKSGKEDKTEESQDGHDDDKGEETSEPAAKVVSVPPKNALLLMRSRSESYYRPTSLAHLFWGSPNEEEDEVTEQNVNPRWSKDTKIEEKDLGVSEEIRSPRDEIGDELKKTRKVFDQFSPIELRRSKSDPARISEEVINDSQNSLWRRRRLGIEFEFEFEEEEDS